MSITHNGISVTPAAEGRGEGAATLANSATAARPRIECVEPSTRRVIGTVDALTAEQVREVVDAARKAQVALRNASFDKRRRVLGRILEATLAQKEELVEWVCRVSGKTRENALAGEIWPVAEKLRWTMANGEKHLAPETVSSGMLVHKKASIEYVPRGVVGAIVPWNYPFQNIMNPVIPALMAGNACVVKASEWIAAASAPFEKLIQDALEAEGLPRELVRVIDGYGETGKALVESGVDVVIFIGSVGNGRRVLEASTKNLIPVVLELGGKDPLVVCDDADLEQAAHAALNGTFINCGQNCVASERILVHEKVAKEFEAIVGGLVGAFRQGAPLDGNTIDVGGMITPLQLDLVDRLVQKAKSQGARVVTGGQRMFTDRGNFFAPTILADVTPDMDIFQEEVFGPVMLLTTVRDDAHAIEVANATRFGLSASVFSKDHARARKIAEGIESGMVAINDFGGMTYMAQDLPFGGVKESGFGRLNGRDGLRSLTQPRAVLEDRFPIHFANKLYPVAEGDFETTSLVVDLVYSPSVGGKLRAARGLLASAFGRGKR